MAVKSDSPKASKLDSEGLAALAPGGATHGFIMDSMAEEARNMLELTVKIANASGLDLSGLEPEEFDEAIEKHRKKLEAGNGT